MLCSPLAWAWVIQMVAEVISAQASDYFLWWDTIDICPIKEHSNSDEQRNSYS